MRAQLVPDARVDVLGHAVYGRTPMTDSLRGALPPSFVDGFSRVRDGSGSGSGSGMGIGVFRPRQPVTAALGLTLVDDYLMWTLPLTGGSVEEASTRLVADWHPTLRRVVAEADMMFPVTLHSARPVAPWTDPCVTLLGDAVHAMSPGRGEGANVALRDAAALCRALTVHGSVTAAKADYEPAMLDYGFAAVTASLERPFGPGGRR